MLRGRAQRLGLDADGAVTWLAFALSLAVVAAIGLLLGFTLNSLLVPSGGAWGDLENSFDLVVCVAPLTLLFLGFGTAAGNWTYAVYPFLAFWAAGFVEHGVFASLADFFASLVPSEIGPSRSDYPGHVSAVFLAYVLVHCIVWPGRLLVLENESADASSRRAAISILVLLAILVSSSLVFAKPALGAWQRWTNAVRLPVSGGLQAWPATNGLYERSGSSSKQVGNYVISDIRFGLGHDIQVECGVGSNWNGRSATYAWSKSPSGIDYGSGASGNGTSITCFLLDGKRYVVTSGGQSNRRGAARNWQPAAIVDAFAAGEKVLPECEAARETYCRPSDTAKVTALAPELDSSSYDDAEVDAGNEQEGEAEYRAVKWLKINRHEISIPLTAELNDLQVAPSLSKSVVNLRSKTLGRESCVNDDGVVAQVIDKGEGYVVVDPLTSIRACKNEKALKRMAEIDRQLEWANNHIR